jgi:hypothetical protein
MVVWGGWDSSGAISTGAKYDATGAAWTPMNPPSPSGRQFHTALWLGNRMIVWGGENAVRLDTGGMYDPVTNTWDFNKIPTAPPGRSHHTAVETSSQMIIWGGLLANGNVTNEGGIFDPAFMP